MIESVKEKKLRKTKKYKLYVWKEMENMQIPVKIGQLTEIPTFRQQIRKGLGESGPAYEITEINTMQETDDDDELKNSLAYSQCQIEEITMPCIIDTGAGGCIISKVMLERLGWEIEEATSMTIIVADGHIATPLGKVHELPIRFGKLIIPTSAIVVDTTSYDLVIGNNWLKRTRAVIDLGASKMRITWKGRKYEIPIDLTRGIRPQMMESDDDEAEEHFMMQVVRTDRKAKILERKSEQAAGFDLSTVKDIELQPGESCVVGTGIAARIPEGHYEQIKPRSSLAVVGITVDAGVIDADFRGEIKMIIINRHKFNIAKLYGGDRVAQLIIIPIWTGKIIEVERIDETKRGVEGFGSTGVNIAKLVTETKHLPKNANRKAYTLGEQLTKQQDQELRGLIEEYQGIFATSHDEITLKPPKHFHHIDVGGHPPIKCAPYRMPPAYQEWQQEEIRNMAESGIVEESSSPWGFSNVIAPKKGIEAGTFAPRMCTDFRRLNDITKGDAFSISRIDDTFSKIPVGANLYTTLDMTSRYYQMGLDKESQEIASFVTPGGHWKYTRMPFGLKNAPASFQKMMTTIFGDLVGKTLLVYIDDITIFTITFPEHIMALREVFERMKMEGLYLKPKKCTFAAKKVAMLGHVIDADGIRTDPTKVEAITKFRWPTDRTEMRALLGLVTYYRRFIKRFASIAELLYAILKKNYNWKDQHQGKDNPEWEVFNRIKWALATALVLAKPDWMKLFRLYTDASAIRVGAVLSQDDTKGQE